MAISDNIRVNITAILNTANYLERIGEITVTEKKKFVLILKKSLKTKEATEVIHFISAKRSNDKTWNEMECLIKGGN